MLSTRVQNMLLALLAALTTGLSAYAIWTVQQSSGAAAAGDAVSPTAPAIDDAALTTAPSPETDEADQGEPAAEVGLDNWAQAWAGPADLVVLGDGFSAEDSQWLALWAGAVGQDRPVALHPWDGPSSSFAAPQELSSFTDGAPLTIWNASQRGTTAQDAAARAAEAVGAVGTPDAVLVSLGLSSAGEDVATGMDRLLEQLDGLAPGVPVLVVVGPDGLYEEGVGDAFASWAQAHDDRVALLDLRSSAPTSPSAEEWALAFEAALQQIANATT